MKTFKIWIVMLSVYMYEFQKENVFFAVLCLSPCCLLNTETL